MSHSDHMTTNSALHVSKTPVRILQVVTTMNRGGLETMLMNYYRQIDRNQIQFDFLVHRNQESDYEKEILKLGGRIYRIQPMNPLSLSYKRNLRKFFKQHPEYSVIHVHQDCMSSVILSEAKRCNLPVRIAHCHSSNQDRDWKYPIKLFYKKKISSSATSLFSCSKDSGFWMFETDDFLVLNNAIDLESFRYSETERKRVRKEFGITDNCLLIGLVGRFYKTKNHEFLVQIFSKFAETNKNSKLLLVGTGTELDRIRSQVIELQLENRVIFSGLRTDIPGIMSALDIFVMPSLYEGTPMVLVEAQASGLPCLISDSIPRDCDLTPLITRCSLDAGAEKWATLLGEIKVIQRDWAYLQLKNKGFDARENADWLKDYYLECLDK